MKNIKNDIKRGLQKVIFANSHSKLALILILFISFITSCEDFVEIDAPRNEIVRETAIVDDETAIAAVSGIYSKMMSGSSFNLPTGGLERLMGLYSDEFLSASIDENIFEYVESNLIASNNNSGGFWGTSFEVLLNINSLIEILQDNENVTQGTKNQIIGEAKFLRAFYHFYLTNLYGPIPIVTSSNVELNNTISRSSEEAVYNQITLDLTEALELMANNFDFISGKRIRPNRDAAIALLARVYLYAGDWQKAEDNATLLINNNLYNLESDLNNTFLATSNEAIWQLQPVLPDMLVPQAKFLLLTTAPTGNNIFFRETFHDEFEINDQRFTNWVGLFSDVTTGADYYFSFKYKNNANVTNTTQEYLIMFRLAEQYLIRAEARAQLGDISGSQSDLNVIRGRASLNDTSAVTANDLLDDIFQERQLELFAEWGHRWFDMKRTGRADEILSPLKTTWKSTNIILPIPEIEITNNPNLLPQNSGY
ncbi:RagB/SusD family nutrient uptake outer membrane protein [Flavivirga amylovorans]